MTPWAEFDQWLGRSQADPVEFFFRDPWHRPTAPYSSSLYRLRQELRDCMFRSAPSDADDDAAIRWQADARIFASAIVAFAGIDLLTKFYTGVDSIKQTGKRFRKTIIDLGSAKATDADVLWAIRCSLMHSFGLYSQDLQCRIAVSFGGDERVVRSEAGRATVNLEGLHRLFVTIHRECRLRHEPTPAPYFKEMLLKHGWLLERSVTEPARAPRTFEAVKGWPR